MTTTPRRLGKYELQKLLGHGNTGEVWQGYDLQQRQIVAVKLLHPDLLQSDSRFIAHFTKEWQPIIALQHPNIVQVREVSITRTTETRVTTPYIVMDFIDGYTTLADFIEQTSRRGTFPAVADIVHIFSSLGAAVDYAHEQEVFHGDIKPTNILLDTRNTAHSANGEPMLTDFGIENLPSNDAAISPLYLSPEQVKGQPMNSRSDIYALGVILYEMCTGVLPFHGQSNIAIMMHHINTLPTPPILINPNIPPDLSEVILRAMAKNPNTRFTTASLLAIAIADACAVTQDPHFTLNRTATQQDAPLFYLSSGPLPLIIQQPLQKTGHTAPILGVSEPVQAVPTNYPVTPTGPVPTISTKFPVVQRQSTGQMQRLSAQTTPKVTLALAHDTSSHHTPALTPTPTPTPPPATTPPVTNLVVPPNTPVVWQRRKSSSSSLSPLLLIIICLVLLLVVIGSLAISLLLHSATAALPKPVVGHVFFQDDALGHNDTLHIEMQGIPAPAQSKRYVAWIQNTAGQATPLGTLSIQNGAASLTYTGNASHANLLSIVQAIFVTLESSGANLPSAPAHNAKVYAASFASAALPYIQHILSSTPNFPGNANLSAELVNSMQGINDKAGSIADSLQGKPDDALAIRQATRIIEMIDGSQFARNNGDLPQSLPDMLTLPVGLLSSPTQQGYLATLSNQVTKLKQVSSNNTELLHHAQNVGNALTDIQNWVAKMRTYDVQILTASNLNAPPVINAALQLKQLAQYAYTGRTIPPNDSPLPTLGSAGAFQAYIECQYMATMDIKKV